MMMEMLLKGEIINVPIDEQIVFSELDYSEDAIWSLMLASGYLKLVCDDGAVIAFFPRLCFRTYGRPVR